MNDKMSQAIAAARSGQSQKAQVLLAQVLKEDQKNVNAWFLLSHLVEAPEKKSAFLKRVLALEPQHQKAQQALANLEPTVVETAVLVEPEAEVVVEPTSEPELPDIIEQETAYNLEEETAVPPPTIAPQENVEQPITAQEPEDLLQQADGNTLPSWLTEDDSDVLSPEALAAEALPDFTESVAKEDLPDWLTKTNIDDWTAEKPWEQAESSADFDFETETTLDLEAELKPKPEIVKSVIDVAKETQESQPSIQPQSPSKPTKGSSDRTLNIVLTILIIVAALVLIGLLFIVISNL